MYRKLFGNRWCGNGSSLGPVLGGTFMMKLEKTIVPQLNEYLKIQKRCYVGNTITFVKVGSVEYIINTLSTVLQIIFKISWSG